MEPKGLGHFAQAHNDERNGEIFQGAVRSRASAAVPRNMGRGKWPENEIWSTLRPGIRAKSGSEIVQTFLPPPFCFVGRFGGKIGRSDAAGGRGQEWFRILFALFVKEVGAYSQLLT